MTLSRREVLITGVGLLIAGGCTERTATLISRPRPLWPEQIRKPQDSAVLTTAEEPKPLIHKTSLSSPLPSTIADSINAIPRTQWTRYGPVSRKINLMNRIDRITVHHEGWTTVWFDDATNTAARLELIRKVHVRDRKWADIGYHYIIDRSGRLWEGRNLRYQGAHVRAHNEHNIGVMLLGNFDKQRPTDSQITALISTLKTLMRKYNVPTNRVFTHQEITPTACPGSHLQPKMVVIRRSGYLT